MLATLISIQQAAEPGPLLILFVSVIAAVVPTLFFVGLVYWVDHYDKEPLWLLSATFLWGAVPSILAALLINSLLAEPPAYVFGLRVGLMAGIIIIAPVVEESLKGLAILGILLLWRHEIDSLLGGIIYGAMVGLGFAMVENVFYFLSTYSDCSSLPVAVHGRHCCLFSRPPGSIGVAAN